jgi:hypothetical protein
MKLTCLQGYNIATTVTTTYDNAATTRTTATVMAMTMTSAKLSLLHFYTLDRSVKEIQSQ